MKCVRSRGNGGAIAPSAKWLGRKRFFVAAVAAMAFFPASAPLSADEAERQVSQRPNVLFILMDDLGWRDVGYAGSTFYETPAIDQLAQDGMVFDNAYVAYPRCVPSRYALMTGRNPARAQIPGGTGGEIMAPEEVTVAEAMSQAGYATFFAGKWHLGKRADEMPEAQGFDVNVAGGHAGAPASYFFPYGGEKGKTMGPGLEEGKEGEYLTDRLTDETIAFLQDHQAKDADRPFFAVLSHYAVHTPLEAKQDLKARFRQKLRAQGKPEGDEFLMTDGETKQFQDDPVYAGMIASMDESVARLRVALDRLGIADNTVIVFTSDHGGLSNRGNGNNRKIATSNLPLRAGKGHLYEGGIKVPMIVYWPGRTSPGSTSDALVINTDHFPSMLQVAGRAMQPNNHLDGQTYLPFLTGAAVPAEPRTAYWYSPRPRPNNTGDTASGAIRKGDYKYFLSLAPGVPSALYDLSKDPEEKVDISAEQPEVVRKLKSELETWLASIDAVKPARSEDDGRPARKGNKKKRKQAE